MNFKIASLILLLAKCVEISAIDVTDLNHTVVNVKRDCGPGSKPCVVKCCGENEVIRKLKKKYICRDVQQLMTEIKDLDKLQDLISSYKDLKISTNGNVLKFFKEDFLLLQSKTYSENLNNGKIFRHFDEQNVQFMENGTIFVNDDTVGAPDFCVDMVIITRRGKPEPSFTFMVKMDDISTDRAQSSYIAYGNIVSSFFIILVLLVYGLLKELHGCVYGMLLMAFIASLMCFNITQAGFILYEVKLNENGEDPTELYFEVCKWIKPIKYFLLLSTFTWLNTMSFDLWQRFRNMRRRNKVVTRVIVRKFLRYSLYAWGVPLAMTVAAVLIDVLADDSVIKPRLTSCKNNNNNGTYEIMYKYIPMAILVFSNIMFYLMTIYNIWLVNRLTTGVRRAGSTRSKDNNNQFKLFTNLFVVMGLNWIIDLAQMPLSGTMEPWLFYLLNTYNAFIGVVLFVVMVCKKRIFIKLCNRLSIKNRWTHDYVLSQASTRTETSKCSKSRVASSIKRESTHADTVKDSKKNPLQNPRFSAARTHAELDT